MYAEQNGSANQNAHAFKIIPNSQDQLSRDNIEDFEDKDVIKASQRAKFHRTTNQFLHGGAEFGALETS